MTTAKTNTTNKIGWRVEFRPTEIQFTDFENSAFCTFIILLTRTILALDLNFLIGITKVTENMERAQEVNACLIQKFHFRENLNETGEAKLTEMTVNEIINGNGNEFMGLMFYINEYLKSTNINAETKTRIDQYLKVGYNSTKLYLKKKWIIRLEIFKFKIFSFSRFFSHFFFQIKMLY